MPNTELMTTRQVAQVLGRSISQTGRLARSGQLVPALKVEGATGVYLFDPSEVQRFQQEKSTESAA